MGNILLVAPLPVDRQRTGPAIRYWEFARVLGREHGVTLLVPNLDHPHHPDFKVQAADAQPLADVARAHQIVVLQGPILNVYPELAEILLKGQHYLVVDLYDPVTLEQMPLETRRPVGRFLQLEHWALLNEQLRMGDFFLCANDRQRDYWLGALSALGRLNHDTWDGQQLRNLVDVVPFGVPAEPPEPDGPVLKGVVPGIEPGGRTILWGGGVWEWLDPLTAVRAMKHLAPRCPDARLVFFATSHSQMPIFAHTRHLAAELDLLDHNVLFADWIPPEKWGACLLEADIGLSCHPASIETHFAFRTRLLDYIWAGLPIVTSEGDVLSSLVAARNLGHVVPPGDAESLAEALVTLIEEPDARRKRAAAFREVAREMRWEQVTQPLQRYCRQPWHAGDKGDTFVKQWQAAGQDRLLAAMSHAQVQRIHLDNCLREAEAAQEQSNERIETLQQECNRLARQLEQSEARFRAAMDGRVMRLMTRVQQAARRVQRGEP